MQAHSRESRQEMTKDTTPLLATKGKESQYNDGEDTTKTGRAAETDVSWQCKMSVMFSCLLLQFHTGGLGYGFSVLLPELVDVFGALRTEAALVQSIFMLIYLNSGLVWVYFMKKFGQGECVAVGGFMTALGLVISSQARNLTTIILALGVFSSIGNGSTFLVSFLALTEVFNEKMSLMLVVVTTGTGIGQFIMPLAINAAIESYGLHGTFLILAGVALHCIPAGLVILVVLRTKQRNQWEYDNRMRLKQKQRGEKHQRQLQYYEHHKEPLPSLHEKVGYAANSSILLNNKTLSHQNTSPQNSNFLVYQPNQQANLSYAHHDVTSDVIHEGKLASYTQPEDYQPLEDTMFRMEVTGPVILLGNEAAAPNTEFLRSLSVSMMTQMTVIEEEDDTNSTISTKELFIAIVKDFQICLLFAIFFLTAFSGNIESWFIVDIVDGKGIDRSAGSLISSMIGVANIASRFLSGVIKFKFSKFATVFHWLYVYPMLALSHLLVLYLTNYWTIMAACILSGVAYGMTVALGPSVMLEVAGVQKYRLAWAVVNCLYGIGDLLQGELTGVIRDATGQYDLAFLVATGTSLLMFLLTIVSACIRQRTLRMQECPALITS